MKQEKGITLISLTIYIIGMAVVIATIAIITTFFYKDINKMDIDTITEYTTFNSYFSDEVNHDNLKIVEIGDNYIVFNNGIQYTYIAENQGIYRNKVKICNKISNCKFKESIQNGKNVVTVTVETGTMKKETTYALKN